MEQTWRVYRGLLVMLEKRGYRAADPKEYGLDAFQLDFCEPSEEAPHEPVVIWSRLDIVSIHKSDRLMPPIKILFCHANSPVKLGVGELKLILTRVNANRSRLLLVLPDGCKVTPQARALVEGMAPDVFFEIFHDADLMTDISVHSRNGFDYRVISYESTLGVAAAVAAASKPKGNCIVCTDPLARFFGLRVGDQLCYSVGLKSTIRLCVFK